MKTLRVLTLLTAVAATTGTVCGQLTFTYDMSPASPQTIPDGNLSGINVPGTVTPALASGKTWGVYSVQLNLDSAVSGINGDIYAKLINGDNYSVLLNRPGVVSGNGTGYGNDGLQFTFVRDNSATSTVDSHFYQTGLSYGFNGEGQALGTFYVDGRDVFPSTTGTEPRTKLLNAFDGSNVNTPWSLFLVDMNGGGQLMVKNWSVTFAEVPEPSQYAMLAGLGLIGFAAYRRYSVKAA